MTTLANVRMFKYGKTELRCCPECGNRAYIEDVNRNECYCNNCGIIHDFKPNEGKIRIVFT